MSGHSNTRRRVFAAIAVMQHGDDARALLEHLSERDRPACEALIEEYARQEDRTEKLGMLLKHLLVSERFTSLSEVHPAWILEQLKEEPPRVVGIIMRSLPSKHVRYLLKHMPPMLRERIPTMLESFAVSPPLLEVIRQRFARRFPSIRITRAFGKPRFDHLYFLKSDELTDLLRELGLIELALALHGMPVKALHMVFNRLDIKDAKKLQRRMKVLGDMDVGLHRQARNHLLEIEERPEGPERMLVSVGLAALAAACGEEYDHVARLLIQKLEPTYGYLFKRCIDEGRMRAAREVASERREIIMGLLSEMASQSRVGSEWMADGAVVEDGVEQSETESDIPVDEETGSFSHVPEVDKE